MKSEDFAKRLIVPPGSRVSLTNGYRPADTADFKSQDEAQELLDEGIRKLAEHQDKLYAQDQYALLVIVQGMDAAGKDGLIKHVMSGVNPQGTQVFSFKVPSAEELDHDYLWRNFKALPERGRIGIFNRSYYEEVLVVRVHPEILAGEHLPPALKDPGIWNRRLAEMNAFEEYLVHNGIVVVKFFLNLSKEVQRQRFLERIEQPAKNWKFSASDAKERAFWDSYMAAYEDMLSQTSTTAAPWYVLPADNTWFTRLAAAEILRHTLHELDLAYPVLNAAQQQALQEARKQLESAGR